MSYTIAEKADGLVLSTRTKIAIYDVISTEPTDSAVMLPVGDDQFVVKPTDQQRNANREAFPQAGDVLITLRNKIASGAHSIWPPARGSIVVPANSFSSKRRGTKMNGKFATSDFLYLTRRSLLQRSAAAGIGAGLVLGLLPGETSAQSPKRGGKLIVGVKGGSTSDPLDPVLMPSQAAAFVTYQYANWLVTRTPSGELKGELTESWESSGDGKRWAFKLKQGIKFHNGKEFTSADVIYSLDRHRAPGSKSPIANLMKGIDNVKADGPYQFSIVLKEPDAGLPYLLTQIYLVMQPKDESPDRGIGTGPYVLEKAEPGKHLRSVETLTILTQTVFGSRSLKYSSSMTIPRAYQHFYPEAHTSSPKFRPTW